MMRFTRSVRKGTSCCIDAGLYFFNIDNTNLKKLQVCVIVTPKVIQHLSENGSWLYGERI